MTDVVLVKQAVERGKVSELEERMAEVRRREDEAVETLRDEGLYTESAFLERTDDGAYLLYYMEAEDIERVLAAFEDSSHEIDASTRRSCGTSWWTARTSGTSSCCTT